MAQNNPTWRYRTGRQRRFFPGTEFIWLDPVGIEDFDWLFMFGTRRQIK